MQIRNLCKFEPAGQTAYCIGFLAMKSFLLNFDHDQLDCDSLLVFTVYTFHLGEWAMCSYYDVLVTNFPPSRFSKTFAVKI